MTELIRRATLSDGPDLQALLHHAYTPNAHAGFNFTAATVSLAALQDTIETEETYLLVVDGTIQGTVTLWRNGGVGYLAVDPDVQGCGYGRKLLAEVEQRGRERGWDRIWLDTPVNHPWLPDFYKRCGYRPVRTVHHDGKNYDSVVLEKVL